MERQETIDEDCFVSPVVFTVKKTKQSKVHSMPVTKQLCRKETTHAKYGRTTQPNLIQNIKKRARPILDVVIDLEYAYGHVKLLPETSEHCNLPLRKKK